MKFWARWCIARSPNTVRTRTKSRSPCRIMVTKCGIGMCGSGGCKGTSSRSGSCLGYSTVQTPADGFKQLLGRGRLLDEVLSLLQVELPAGDVRAVAAGKDYLQRRPLFPQAGCQFESAYAFRHHDVRQEKVNGTVMFLPNPQSLDAVGCLQYLIAARLQHSARQ